MLKKQRMTTNLNILEKSKDYGSRINLKIYEKYFPMSLKLKKFKALILTHMSCKKEAGFSSLFNLLCSLVFEKMR